MAKSQNSNSRKAALTTSISVAAVLGLANLPAADIPKPPRIYSGPYLAHVLKITDSDTLKLAVHIWPDQTVTVGMRENGIDTPETFRPKCALEKSKARDATNFVKSIVQVGGLVEVTNVKIGKFGRRAVGTIDVDPSDSTKLLREELFRYDHGVAYSGKGPKEDWCAE